MFSKWTPEGGKSRAFFAKTRDDRFVIKQLSRTELASFLSLAPEYFKHMHQTHHQEQRSTCLTKILGVYSVTLKKPGGEGIKMDLAVMENLLYGRRSAQVYDLKGSLRSRYVNDKVSYISWSFVCAVRFIESRVHTSLSRVVLGILILELLICILLNAYTYVYHTILLAL